MQGNGKGEIRKKLILVDDVSFGLSMGRNRLKDFYQVYPAQSGHRLFELLEKITPDVILLDIHMPDEDGYTVLQKLKADARTANIPVIFLTSASDEESVIKGITLGASGHVSKPYSIQTLRKLIEEVLNPHSVQNPLYDDEEDVNRPRILAVDDSPAMLKSIHYALCDLYKVYTLSKPERVESFLRKVTPDLFLLDYKMPEMNGFELIPIIRNFSAHRETPIVFLTSEGTVDHLTAAIHLGACEFIVKPFSTRVLRKKIETHLNKKPESTKEEDL